MNIKEYIKKILEYLFSLCPINNNMILMESNSEIKDNTKALFEKMLELNVNKNYKIIWLVQNVQEYKNSKFDKENVYFVEKKIKNNRNFKFLYYCCTAKYCFYTHRFIGLRKRKGQIKVFLTHRSSNKRFNRIILESI